MNLISQLVRDTETGKLCIQVKLGSSMAIHELDDNTLKLSDDELKTYFRIVVPEMIKGLHDKKPNAQRGFKKKAAKQ